MNRTEKFLGIGSLALALLVGMLPFVAPAVCAQSLREGLALCSGPLLVSLFPFLVVSSLLVQSPAGEILGLPFRPIARLVGVRSACAGRVLLIGFFGGFAPAASAAAEAVRTRQMTPSEADTLLPACVCSGPSFVILTVGQDLLGNMDVGVLLFLAQVSAGYLSAALLARLRRRKTPAAKTVLIVSGKAPSSLQLHQIIATAVVNYGTLCGFVLFFRMLAAGVGSFFPPAVGTFCAMALEVCSGCDLASRTGRWASLLCCASLSVQGLSVLLQVRALCPPEMTLKPLLWARMLHLPLSMILFYLLLPGGEQQTFYTACTRVVPMQRVPLDCALLVFALCCLAVCKMTDAVMKVK